MADHVDSLRVDGEGRLDVPDDAGEVSRIVDPFVVEVAACVGSVPEMVRATVQRSVWVDVQVTALRREVSEMEVLVVFAAGRAVSVKEDEERCRVGCVVPGRNP